MATPSQLVDSNLNAIDSYKDESFGLGTLVYTRPRDERRIENKALINSTYGAAMNQNGSGIVTITENIHDGTDNTYWTATAISGSWTFDSTDENHTPAGSM